MPRRADLQSILVLSVWPIVIGQPSEFDYSRVEGCKALRAEDYRVFNADAEYYCDYEAFLEAVRGKR